MTMKNKKDLLIIAIAAVSVIFIAVIYFAAGASKSVTQEAAKEAVLPVETEDAKEAASLEKETAKKTQKTDEFAKQFAENLPEGYIFSEELTANPERDGRMQLDVLDESGAEIGIAIVFSAEDTKNAGSQMALTIKEDSVPDDADAVLKWYLFTFLEGYTEEKKKAIYDAYLYMFDTGSKDYRVYTEENVIAMMSCETESTGNYYYIMISEE